jgi:hypothetical protein
MRERELSHCSCRTATASRDGTRRLVYVLRATCTTYRTRWLVVYCAGCTAALCHEISEAMVCGENSRELKIRPHFTRARQVKLMPKI